MHGLLLTSQGSYLGAKIFKDKIAVNRIFPNVFTNDISEIEFNLVGGGFTDGMKVILEGSDKPPVTTTVSSPSSMSCKLHSDKIIGMKNLIIIQPIGISMTLNGIIEITQAEPNSKEKRTSDTEETKSKGKKNS